MWEPSSVLKLKSRLLLIAELLHIDSAQKVETVAAAASSSQNLTQK
jgi:hypothetical protein